MPCSGCRLVLAILLVVSILLPQTPSVAAGGEASLLLTGARVWTGDPARPWAEAVAVGGERILAVGTGAEVAAYRGPATRVIDLQGRFGGLFRCGSRISATI